jgi:hypothetical protein
LGGLLPKGLSLCARPSGELLKPEPVVLGNSHEPEADKEHQWCQPYNDMPLNSKVVRRARVTRFSDAVEALESLNQGDGPDAGRSYGNEPQQEPQASHRGPSIVSARRHQDMPAVRPVEHPVSKSALL